MSAEIRVGESVELIAAAAAAPAGARGVVTELLDGVALVEVSSPPLAPVLDRLVAVPVAELRSLRPLVAVG